MADRSNALDVLAQVAGRLSPAQAAGLPTIAKSNRGPHNYPTGNASFPDGTSVKLLYAAAHVQLYDLLDSRIPTTRPSRATSRSRTKLHVALLGETHASRSTILGTLRRIVQYAVAHCPVWNPAQPLATPWVRDHINWCKSLRLTAQVYYPNLQNPQFYRTHLVRAVEVCRRVLSVHTPRPNPQAALRGPPGHPAHVVVARPMHGQPPVVHLQQVPVNRQQVVDRRQVLNALRGRQGFQLVDPRTRMLAMRGGRQPAPGPVLVNFGQPPQPEPPRPEPPRDYRGHPTKQESDSDSD